MSERRIPDLRPEAVEAWAKEPEYLARIAALEAERDSLRVQLEAAQEGLRETTQDATANADERDEALAREAGLRENLREIVDICKHEMGESYYTRKIINAALATPSPRAEAMGRVVEAGLAKRRLDHEYQAKYLPAGRLITLEQATGFVRMLEQCQEAKRVLDEAIDALAAYDAAKEQGE